MSKWSQNALIAVTTRAQGRVTAASLAGFDALICKVGGSENSPTANPYTGYTERVKNPYWDDELDYSIQAAYDAPNPDGTKGIPCGVSYTCGPRAFTEMGVDAEDYGAVAIDRHPVFSILLNRLRLGSGWKAVHFVQFNITDESLNMSGGYGVGPKDIAAYIDDVRERIIALRKVAGFPNIPFGFYSRNNLIEMIDAKDPKTLHVKTWFENNVDSFLHTASFPGVKVGPVEDAATIKLYHMPGDVAKPLPWGYLPKRDAPTAEYPGWSMWNYCGPASPHRYALSLFNGTREVLWSWLKFRQTVPPPPPPPEPTDSAALQRIEMLEAQMKVATPILDRANRHLAA